jgi:hypothetical protein
VSIVRRPKVRERGYCKEVRGHRAVVLAFIAALLLVGCGQSTTQVTRDTAIKAGLAEVETLARERTKMTSLPLLIGFVPTATRMTRHTSPVSDSQGDELRVSPAPREVWVVEFAAPPQGIWGSISALAVVDSATGVVAGSGLWAVPANRPVKTASP